MQYFLHYHMRSNSLISVLGLFGLAMLIYSCKHEVPVPGFDGPIPTESVSCEPQTVYFVQEVLPIIQGSCAISGCHDAASAEDGVILNNYLNIVNTGEVVPGNAGESELYEVLVDSDPDDVMPPPGNTPLTSSEISTIVNWVNQGASNNSCLDLACDTLNVGFSATIAPIIDLRCDGCHSAIDPDAGIALTNYAEISDEALNGTLLDAIKDQNGAVAMPYNGNPLSNCDIRAIEIWIENGAQND